MEFNTTQCFYPGNTDALKAPEFKALVKGEQAKKTDSGMTQAPFSYECDSKGNVDISSVKPLNTPIEDVIPGQILSSTDEVTTVSGILNDMGKGQATIVFCIMSSAGAEGVSLINDSLLTLSQAYYRADEGLTKEFSTFMSVDAVLSKETKTVIDFTKADADYGNLNQDSSAIIKEDDKTITFKAYVANGGFNVCGQRA